MNRENLTQQDIDLVSLLGYSVTLKSRFGDVLEVGRLHTHKDTYRNGKRFPKTLKYFSVTNDNGNQWVLNYNEVFKVDNKTNQIVLNW